MGPACRSDNNKADWVRRRSVRACIRGGWRLVEAETRWHKSKQGEDSLVTGLCVDVDLYVLAAGGLLGLLVAVLLVDADLFAQMLLLLGALGLAVLALLENTDVFGVGLAALSRLLDVDREGFLTFRVTFPPCLW